jgi:hypothetical protein
LETILRELLLLKINNQLPSKLLKYSIIGNTFSPRLCSWKNRIINPFGTTNGIIRFFLRKKRLNMGKMSQSILLVYLRFSDCDLDAKLTNELFVAISASYFRQSFLSLFYLNNKLFILDLRILDY